MSAVIAILALNTFVTFGFLFVFVMLLVGMRTEGTRLRASNSPHCPVGNAALAGFWASTSADRRRHPPSGRDRLS